MDRLWSPWRFSYVGSKPQGCVFCQKPVRRDANLGADQQKHDAEQLILHRGTLCYVVMNLYPYNTAHMMVVPFGHLPNLADLSKDERAELIELSAAAERVLRLVYKPDGINMGLNLGEAAGAGVIGHLHLHVLPRWLGDANFLTVVGETRVLPEALASTYARLLEGFRSVLSELAD